MKTLLLLALVLSPSAFAEDAAEYTYKLLKDSRSEITYPEYGLTEKQQMLEHVQLSLDQIFTHRDTKLEHFGAASDHVPQLAALAPRLNELTTTQFHAAMAKVIFNLQDLHTSYHYPKPHACYRTYLPFSFKEAKKADGTKIVGVYQLVDTPEVLAQLPERLNVVPGDELISINGVPVQDQLALNRQVSSGANAEAIQRRAVGLLSFMNNRSFPLPAADVAVVEIKKPDGSIVSVTAPWITKSEKKCLAPSEKEENAHYVGLPTGMNDDLVESSRVYRSHTKKLSRKDKSLEGWKDTQEPILKYRFIRNEHGYFGALRLESFVPEKLSIEETLALIKQMLEGEFFTTDGLIIDLRDNGGGYIGLAEGMIQFFTAKNVTPLLFRLRNSAANLHVISQWGDENPFLRALRQVTGTNATFAPALPLNDDAITNSFGQSYFSPVVVLNNANCYSSCDMFSALMQDHGAAVLVGEDSTTGAGGANNTNYNDLTNGLKPDNMGPFIKLPAKQNIGFSFRQVVRQAPRAGQLLEDIGAVADERVETSVEDLQTGSTLQFLHLSRRLKELTPAEPSWFLTPTKTAEIVLNAPVQIRALWENVDHLEIYGLKGKLGEVDIQNSAETATDIELPATIETNTIGKFRLELIGFKNGKRVSRRMFSYRTVPSAIAMTPGEALVLDFKNILTNPLVFYQYMEPELGWQYVDGVRKIGKGALYADNVGTTASLFVKLPAGSPKLETEFELSTEAEYDGFSIGLVLYGQEFEVQPFLSGVHERKKYQYDLSPYSGMTVELRLNFNSDGGVQDKGVTVHSLQITP